MPAMMPTNVVIRTTKESRKSKDVFNMNEMVDRNQN